MKSTENVIVKSSVMLSLTHHLQHLPLLSINSMRGRCPADRPLKFRMLSLYDNGGFTLIELLVVVLIIGILAAVAVPQYQKAVVKSRLATLKSLVTAVANAAEVYYLAHGIYPDKLSELDIDVPAPDSTQYKEEELVDIATYPWGICYLSKTSNKLFQCNNLQVNIGYAQRFLHSSSRPGARSCSALNNATQAVSVCQQETGHPLYYHQGDDGHGTIVESYLY